MIINNTELQRKFNRVL